MSTTIPTLARSVSVIADYGFIDCSFDDETWFVAQTNHDRTALHWNSIILRDRLPLTAARHRDLLNAAKHFLILMADGGVARSRKPRGGTLAAHFRALKKVIEWMSSRGLRAFSELSLPHVVGYRNYTLAQTTARRRNGSGVSQGEKLLAPGTRKLALNVIVHLVQVQERMAPMGTNLRLHEVEEILRLGPVENETDTLRIPDHIFTQTLTAAIRMIREVGPVVVAMESDFEKFRSDGLASAGNRGRCLRKPRGFTHFRQYKCIKSRPITVADAKYDLTKLDRFALLELRTALRGACFVVIAGLVGMRMSEIRSVRRGCLDTKQLHGGRSLLKLQATLFKTANSAKGEDASWVAGWDEPENPVRAAVQLLEVLTNDYHLFGRLRGSRKILDAVSMRRTLQVFLEVSKCDVGWHFTPHQFRKTFARFVALAGPSAPVALMRHFKHVSIQMTERYFPNDPELINEIIEASEELIAQSLSRVLGADKLSGMRGLEILSRNEGYRGPDHAEELAELVRLTMLDPSVYIVQHVYGICIYDRQLARCGGNIEEVGLSTCTGCVNFAVSAEHLPFWREQLARLEANLALESDKCIVNLDLHRQVEEAKRMIVELGAA